MKFQNFSIYFLPIIIISFTGCATKKETISSVAPNVPKPSVYIDNTIDMERHKNAVETYLWAINNTDTFKVEINEEPKIFPLDIQRNLIKGTTIYCEIFSKESNLSIDTNIVTYNYKYPNMLMDSTIKYKDKKFYDKKYSATPLIEGESFEIIGFDSKKEAMDIFVELMRSSTFEYKLNLLESQYIKNENTEKRIIKTNINQFYTALHNAPKPKNLLHSIDYWDLSFFYQGRGFVFDPYALENENRLIITPTIKLYSLKNQLLVTLSTQGYKVVDDPKQANMIINTENIYFGTFKNYQTNLSTYIDDYLKNSSTATPKKQTLTQETESLVNQASTASSMGHTDIAKGYVGLAAANIVLNMLGGNTKPPEGLFISNMSVRLDNKEIVSTPNFVKIMEKAKLIDQALCNIEFEALKSSKIFVKFMEKKLSEEK